MSMRAGASPMNCWSGANSTPAIEAYQGGLKGIFEHDPTLLAGLAKAQFAKNDFAAARATLERLAAAQSGLQVARVAVAAMRERSRLWMPSTRRSAPTRPPRRAFRARKRGCATRCS